MGASKPFPVFRKVECDPSSDDARASGGDDGFGALDWAFDDDVQSGATRHAREAGHASAVSLASRTRTTPVPSGEPSLEVGPFARADQPDGSASRSPQRPARGSDKAPRAARLRELYANGDADAALALAEEIHRDEYPTSDLDPVEVESDVEHDPFGGPVPVVDEEGAPPNEALRMLDAIDGGSSSYDAAVAALSLTERQGIPRVVRPTSEITKLRIDHRQGFLLSFVDGTQTLEEILDICAMPSAEALALISSLKEMGVIEFE